MSHDEYIANLVKILNKKESSPYTGLTYASQNTVDEIRQLNKGYTNAENTEH